ncbi:MAG: D-2-hydroxyacid dehydrogenase [Chloroflexi bacterium]|nr:D-2-hydroxyacid dehydrogenase [Chloroflexota bacterium]
MQSVNVLVTTAIGDENVRRITAVSPGIKLTDVSSLSRAEYGGDAAAKKKLDDLLAEVEVILGGRFPPNIIARAPRLKWIQVMSAGVNRFLDSEMVASPVVITNVSGIHAVQISEFVLGLMLMFVKQSPLCFQLKQEKQWKRFTLSVLRSKTVGIVGLGHIGREVARLAKAFGMRVLATRRSVKRVGRARYVDIMLPQDQLRRLLRESDFVVLTLPLTPETDKFFGEEELRSMKSSAYLINIARGGLVDEEVLIRALDEHWIAGAGLDVFTTEPLPAGSRLWELPNVLLSPHISGSLEDNLERTTDIFLENLRRYLNGEKLFNVVDKKKGY